MPTLKLGFALEGSRDLLVIPTLTERVVLEAFPEINFAERAVSPQRNTGHGLIKNLPIVARWMQDAAVDILVAVVDTDNTRIDERGRRFREAKALCQAAGLALCIAEGLAVRQLEAWLLADEAALWAVCDGVHRPAPLARLEDLSNPKAELDRRVRELTGGADVTVANYATSLSQQIDLRRLRRQCRHFDEFAGNVIDCVRDWQRATPPSPEKMSSSARIGLVRKVR